MKMKTIGLMALLGSLTTLSAIERPNGKSKSSKVPARPAPPQGGILGNGQGGEAARPQTEPGHAKAGCGYLGVGGSSIDEALKAQLNLKGGLLLTTIDPTSPAAAAGLKEYDILTQMGGRMVESQDALRQLVKGYKPGDQVDLEFVRGGKSMERKLKLGKAPFREQGAPDVDPLNQPEDLGRLLNDRFGGSFHNFGDDALRRDLLERLEKAMGNQGADFRGLSFDFDGGLLEDHDKKAGFSNFSKMSLRDSEGSIEVSRVNGKRQVVIRDKNNTLLFEGPYDTNEEKAAVPEEYRKRLERLDLSGGNNFLFKREGRRGRRSSGE